MRTAFAFWRQRIAPVFDTARHLYIVDEESGRVVRESRDFLAEDFPAQRVQRLLELKVGALVCGAISRPLFGLLAAAGIPVFPFVAGDLNEVVRAWLDGTLQQENFSMPGCCDRGGRHFRLMQGRKRKENTMPPRGQGTGQGRSGGRGGRMGGPAAAGPEGLCVCPQCGEEQLHQRGVPCFESSCPKCGARMVRK